MRRFGKATYAAWLRRWRRFKCNELRRLRTAQDGFTLVTLIVMFTILNILVATALPMWSGVIQRDKEYEFLFRGLQYAEAIRVYQTRYGQQPQKLKDLSEDKGKGRCIRQLWTNPLTNGGTWDPVFAGLPNTNGQEPRQNSGLDGNNRSGDNNGRESQDNAERGPLGQRLTGSDEIRIGPIIGVSSKQKPKLVERNIPQWNFTAQIFQTRGVGLGEATPSRSLPVNAEDIGLPLPGSPAGGNNNSAGGTNLGGSVGGAGSIGGGGNTQGGNRG